MYAQIDIEYQDGKVVATNEIKRWLIEKIVNRHAFIASDAPVLIRALVSNEWEPFSEYAWTMCVSEWQGRGNIFEVRENISWVQDYTKSHVLGKE